MTDNDVERMLEEESKYVDFMRDVLTDRNKDVAFLKVAILILSMFVLVMIIGIMFVNIYNQNLIKEQAENSEKRMYEFLSQYDFEGDIDLQSAFNDNNSGNINVTR
jgi:hypothetical protein